MRVVITGHKGQLGRQFLRAFEGHEVRGVDVPEHDITDYRAIVDAVVAFEPQLVVHGAAYTNVDGCARDPDLAFRVNALGTQNLAVACQRLCCPMVYISTNEVFDGAGNRSYLETDRTNPINAYGRSKEAGEASVRALLSRYYIVRIAWLFSPGSSNFPAKMISLAREGRALSVVTDEVSSPTYAPDLAEAVYKLAHSGRYGIYHLVNEGQCSRHEFARTILDGAGLDSVPVAPILLKDYERASTPPPYAPLRNFAAAEALGIRLRPWKDALADYLSREP
ncbi:MAG: dTDP-4-dehydrorhamnose reductase [Anaerolineae bacterium]|nr:dTDP-4-dehydrorhamnose reductase [Anaerolineae bacterium]